MSGFPDPGIYAGLLTHFARYFDACDRCDIDAVMQIMDGATVGVGENALSDPAVIRGMYVSRQEPPLPDGRRVTKHHITNLLVDGPDPDGVYEATVYYFRLQPGEHGPYVATSGRLRETVRRDGDRFAVLGHSIVTDF